MNRKTILAIFLAGFLGSMIGVIGTISAQAFLFPKDPGERAIVKEEGPIIPIGEFTLNLQGGAFLKAQISVEGMNEKSEDAIVSKKAVIKDRINTVLSSKSIQDVQPEVREKLKNELVEQLNEVTNNNVQDIFFESFVYQ
ncbi:MAG: flagellar basal body-associated protein FliL [Desulfitobacterium sp.]|nr:flagellar basal body-associated protein FliL [Desulfitobacterium sp.]